MTPAATIAAPTDDVDIVVLDAHGVVFDRAFPAFVQHTASHRGDDVAQVWHRWRTELRLDFWEGRLTAASMWRALFPGDNPARLTAELERSYRPGPLFRFAAAGDRRLWLLSNHRTGWLHPRLVSFGIADRFERVLISDELGAAKPDPRAFAPVLDAMSTSRIRLLDDSAANVDAARAVGIDAGLVAPIGDGAPTGTATAARRPCAGRSRTTIDRGG